MHKTLLDAAGTSAYGREISTLTSHVLHRICKVLPLDCPTPGAVSGWRRD